jgi:hypothetical protein
MLKFFQMQQSKLALSSPSQKQLRTTTASTSSLYGTDVVVEEHRQLVDMIARHVVYGNLLRFLNGNKLCYENVYNNI